MPGEAGKPVRLKALKQILYAEDDPDIRTIVELSMASMTDVELVACEAPMSEAA